MQLTLIREPSPLETPVLNPEITLRPVLETDSDALAQLYIDAYGTDVFASLQVGKEKFTRPSAVTLVGLFPEQIC